MRLSLAGRALVFCLAVPALGVSAAGLRAHAVATPLIDGHYYGPIEGRILAIDRSASDLPRLTLDRVVLPWTPPDRLPGRVRISLHGDQRWLRPEPGMTVILTGHLAAPEGPVEPGGFDFRRHAWFLGLGGVGYTRTPVLMLEPPEGGRPVASLRHRLTQRIHAALPGDRGAVAAAILTGDRSGLSEEILSALRRSNLAHLLAISGLHMGLVAGLVFSGLRFALVLVPGAGLRWPVKKIAAAAAILAAAAYLALSGATVATQRAFVMVTVMLLAVLLGRRALSLRSVALAALIVLAAAPEALLSPGFQMSFAATTALVAAFAFWRDTGIEARLPRWTRGAAALVLSSAVAGAATAPFAMAHFNQVAHFGLMANLAAVPLMGVLVMPAGLVALVLMPFGLEALPLWIMGLGLDWIIGVARVVSNWPGAVGAIRTPPGAVLPLVAAAGVLLVLVRGRGKWSAVVPAMGALILWAGTPRPWLLVAPEGALVGVMTETGRALSKPSGAGFTAALWLENDGDPASREESFARWSESGVRHLTRKADLAAFTGCAPGEVVVTRYPLPVSQECLVLGPDAMQGGAIAVARRSEGYRITTNADLAGRRLWSPSQPAGPAQ